MMGVLSARLDILEPKFIPEEKKQPASLGIVEDDNVRVPYLLVQKRPSHMAGNCFSPMLSPMASRN